jgi:hypothetical protein
MPFALTTIGLLFIITGFQDTYKQFFTEVEGDFTGPQSFIYWLISFGVVGSLGYIDELKTFSRVSMALILLAMILADKGGVFSKFTQAVQQGSTTPVNAPGDNLPATGSNQNSTGNSTSASANDTLQTVGQIASIAAVFA